MRKREIKYWKRKFNRKNLSKELEEELMHDDLICFDHDIDRCIVLFPSLNKNIDPYFVVFNHTRLFTATKCCRISCTSPKYLIPKDTRLPHFELKMKDIDWIMEVLPERWNDMVQSYYEQRDWDFHNIVDPIPMPNYYELLKVE